MSHYTNKIVILDLDHTLIVSSEHLIHGYDFTVTFQDGSEYYVKKRDYCDEFIDFCFQYFSRVIVWSAGDYDYVHQIVNHIFIKNKPEAVYSRPDTLFLNEEDHLKPLSKILDNLDHAYIIDDRMENFRRNTDNGILIVPYVGEEDFSLLKIQKWLLRDETINSDVRIDKRWEECNLDEMHYLVTSDRLYHLENS